MTIEDSFFSGETLLETNIFLLKDLKIKDAIAQFYFEEPVSNNYTQLATYYSNLNRLIKFSILLPNSEGSRLNRCRRWIEKAHMLKDARDYQGVYTILLSLTSRQIRDLIDNEIAENLFELNKILNEFSAEINDSKKELNRKEFCEDSLDNFYNNNERLPVFIFELLSSECGIIGEEISGVNSGSIFNEEVYTWLNNWNVRLNEVPLPKKISGGSLLHIAAVEMCLINEIMVQGLFESIERSYDALDEEKPLPLWSISDICVFMQKEKIEKNTKHLIAFLRACVKQFYIFSGSDLAVFLLANRHVKTTRIVEDKKHRRYLKVLLKKLANKIILDVDLNKCGQMSKSYYKNKNAFRDIVRLYFPEEYNEPVQQAYHLISAREIH